MTDHAALVRGSLAGPDEFDRRVREQADDLVDALERGAFDNDAATLGLELEVYAVATGDGPASDAEGDSLALAPIPDDVYDGPADKELGRHNAELNAAPSRFDDAGVEAQAESVAADLADARERAREHGLEIVLDAMPAVAPDVGTAEYLDDVEVRRGDGSVETATGCVVPGPDPDDPVLVARNMRMDPRYGALDNEAVRRGEGALPFDVPGASLSFRTILFESLATSIQPHVQVPSIEQFPAYHNYAVRTLGPLLALSTNSPFLPGDCYGPDGDGGGADDVADPAALVDRTHHELRIAAFEQSMNQACRKVRVPDDLDGPADAVEHVVADDTYAPFLREWVEADDEDEEIADAPGEDPDEETHERVDPWEFDYKRGTFWRWVRGVPGGESVAGACDERSLRIEYRPLPTQPTVRDIVGLQVLTAGLLRGLVATEHPVVELPRDDAERGFYAAVENGLDAELSWITASGERTTDSAAIFEDVFAAARRGLDEQGVSGTVQERYLGPIERRWELGVTPSVWKKRRVRESLAEGADLETALAQMQSEYVELSREFDSFVEWV